MALGIVLLRPEDEILCEIDCAEEVLCEIDCAEEMLCAEAQHLESLPFRQFGVPVRASYEAEDLGCPKGFLLPAKPRSEG